MIAGCSCVHPCNSPSNILHHALPFPGGASNSAWANEFINDAEDNAYADWEALYAKNSVVSTRIVDGTSSLCCIMQLFRFAVAKTTGTITSGTKSVNMGDLLCKMHRVSSAATVAAFRNVLNGFIV